MADRFPVFDHLKHAERHPPNALIQERWAKALLDRSNPEGWNKLHYARAPEKRAVLEGIAHWIKAWLKTLPPDATVSARQLLEVFVPNYEDHGTGKDAELAFKRWSAVLSAVRYEGLLDGWWSKGDKPNKFGNPYINHHNERKSA